MIAGNLLRRVATRGVMMGGAATKWTPTASAGAGRFLSSGPATFNVEGSFEVGKECACTLLYFIGTHACSV